MGNDCPGPWYSAVISSLVWLDPPPVSWALNGLDDSSVCMNSSMLSFNPKNSLYWWVQMKLKSAPALLIRGQMQARNFSALVPFFFFNSEMLASHTVPHIQVPWVGWFFFCFFCLCYLTQKVWLYSVSVSRFPLCGVHPWLSACAHGGMCAMHDLFGQCILRSGSECPSSHCVGVHVSVYCISVLFCPDWLICKKHLLAQALPLLCSMLLSC